jgi:transcriptional regulator with XRE-family HTH domain
MRTMSLSITRSELARALACLRVSRGRSQEEVARAACLPVASISAAEGEASPPPSTRSLEALVTAMGYSIASLLMARDFVRALDAETLRTEAWQESALGRRLDTSIEPSVADKPAARASRCHFPGPRTTNWFGPRWPTPKE